MEIYKEITLAELFASILNENYQDIYYKNIHRENSLWRADKCDWKFKEFKDFKFFKREVVSGEDSENIR